MIKRISGIVLILIPFFFFEQSLAQVSFSSSNLPIVVITTNGQAIVDDPKIEASMGIIYNGVGVRNSLTDPFNNYNGKIGIEIRGSSSQMFPKKQYGIELHDAVGASLDASLLGLPQQSDWILFAPYNDKSLVRDPLAYKLGRDLGRYAPRTKYCEVVLNGQYQGIYILIEKIKRDKNRVDISKLDPIEISGDDLTGGYIIKIDKDTGTGGDGWMSTYTPPGRSGNQTIFYQYDYPKASSIATQQKAYIKQYMTAFENALAANNFKDPDVGYAKYIDVNSFIDYFIANEVSKNVDAYRLSTFMHKKKDSDGGKLIMGPIWDFNLGFGNADYCTKGNPEGLVIRFNSLCNKDFWLIPFWWDRLLEDPAFRDKLIARWTALRSDKLLTSKIHSYIDSVTAVLNVESQQRNFQQWPVLGKYVWPNYYVGQTYQQEVDWLKNWTEQRMTWLDNFMTDLVTGISESKLPGFSVEAYPNPFKNDIQVEYTLEKPGLIAIELLDGMGRKVSAVEHQHDEPGVYRTKIERHDFSPGIYYYRVKLNNGSITTGKLIRQ